MTDRYDEKVEELEDPTSATNFSSNVATIFMKSLNTCLLILVRV